MSPAKALPLALAVLVSCVQHANAEGRPASNAISLDAAMGLALFERQWVPAPSSTKAADGLGPVFNARSCNACHAKGGPARFSYRDGSWKARGLVVRTATEEGLPHPELGRQIQDHAEPGLPSEGRIALIGDRAHFKLDVELSYRNTSPVQFEARMAPPLQAAALFEQVDERAILALADPDDRNSDGISGRPNVVDTAGGRRVGLYGNKAAIPNLGQQIAEAAALDLGLSSPLVPNPSGDCTVWQRDCLIRAAAASDDEDEISSDVIRLIAAYLATLPAPQDGDVTPGRKLFAEFGCAACHVPSLPAKDGQRLTLFSDFLLHDLGPANSSILREGDAAPGEWRTAPLRSLASPDGMRRYMHDGRAATLVEAIKWHGGEATGARAAFLQSDGRERRVLLDYLSKL